MNATPIDIHTHVVPEHFPPHARADHPRWPQMDHGPGCGHANVMIGGKNFRTVTDECWDIDRRVEAMTAAGIGRQVLSPMPELLSYWLDVDDALSLGRHVNDTIATMVQAAPDRFAGLGMVPLQDPEVAARELERLMATGQFRGVEIGTNVNGAIIGEPKFEVFFQAAEELGAAVFVHALHPAGTDRLIGSPQLAALVAFPCETAFAIASLITGGILLRHPKLRLAFSHGGGVFAMVLPRLLHGWRTVQTLAPDQSQIDPIAQARALYYDTLVYDADTLRFLIERFGKTQLCIGTDHPFSIQETRPLAPIDALGLGANDRDLLLFGNARRFLGEA